MPENNDGAKVCVEKHGDNCNDGSAGCINNEINNGDEGDGIHRLSRPAMAFTNPLSIISGHLYSTDDKLKRGSPPPFLKNACEDVVVGEEPMSSCCVGVPLGFSNSAWRHDNHSPYVLGTSDAGVDNALLLLAVLPHTHHFLGTSNIAAGTALHLLAVLPPTHSLLRTCDIAAGAALHLPACCLLLLLFSEHPA
ncbi:unnamed protein product [Prunus armeniaca]